jgi:hypothetical protein
MTVAGAPQAAFGSCEPAHSGTIRHNDFPIGQ